MHISNNQYGTSIYHTTYMLLKWRKCHMPYYSICINGEKYANIYVMYTYINAHIHLIHLILFCHCLHFVQISKQLKRYWQGKGSYYISILCLTPITSLKMATRPLSLTYTTLLKFQKNLVYIYRVSQKNKQLSVHPHHVQISKGLHWHQQLEDNCINLIDTELAVLNVKSTNIDDVQK